MDLSKAKNVAIIGAGAAGLSAARQLHAHGLICTIFESGSMPGGFWISQHSNFEVLVQPELYEFPDWPLPAEASDSISRLTLKKYFEDYAKYSGVWPHIHFNTPVTNIQKRVDGKPGWLIRVIDNGFEREQAFDLVVVCIGHSSSSSHSALHGTHSKSPAREIYLILRKRLMMSRCAGALIPAYYNATAIDRLIHVLSKPPAWVWWCLSQLLLHTQYSMWAGLRTTADQHMDAVIPCERRKTECSFLENSLRMMLNIEKGELFLYRQMIHPDAPDLVFINQVMTLNNMITCSLQVRWLCELIKGTHQLPSRKYMRINIEQVNTWKRKHIPFSTTRGSRLDSYTQHYHDELLRDFGASPLRKTGLFAPLKEIFEPYRPRDYRSIVLGDMEDNAKGQPEPT